MMDPKISVVVNTLNEEKNIERVLRSVEWADEVLVCDMYSDDDTAVIAKKLGAKIIFHKRTGYVEPARNLAISKASGEWILVVDADEEIPNSLAQRLMAFVRRPIISTYVDIPRKNIIFGKWITGSLWWPDYNTRFFKAGSVKWSDKIHSKPTTSGQGLTLPSEERWAIIHHHYDSISQFVARANRYSDIQARELKKSGYELKWSDILLKPLEEFVSRFFANNGYKDGLHGLVLSLLQAFSFLLVYLKIWEMEDFKEEALNLSTVKEISTQAGKDLNYWFRYSSLSKNPLKRFLQKAKNKLS